MPRLRSALLFLHGGGTLTIKRVSVRVPEGEEDVLFVSDPTDPLGSFVIREWRCVCGCCHSHWQEPCQYDSRY